jgi:hypothetical protein
MRTGGDFFQFVTRFVKDPGHGRGLAGKAGPRRSNAQKQPASAQPHTPHEKPLNLWLEPSLALA